MLWRNLAQDLQHELRTSAYAHVQNLDLAYFEDRSSGGLVAVLNDDVNQLERFLNGGASDLIQVVVTVIACGAVFFAISPQIAVLAFLPIPVILWGAFYFQRKAGPRYDVVREEQPRCRDGSPTTSPASRRSAASPPSSASMSGSRSKARPTSRRTATRSG